MLTGKGTWRQRYQVRVLYNALTVQHAIQSALWVAVYSAG
jgi:hypothetical protein